MKITKHGQQATEIWVGKCYLCGSEAECERKELTHIERSQRDGTWAWETCPVCAKKTAMCFHPKGVK